MEININISFYKNKCITDCKILNLVGVINYTYLQRRYPYFFKKFHECNDVYKYQEGNIPNVIFKYIDSDPIKIKKDLILYLCGEEIKSNTLLLISKDNKPNHPLIQNDDFYLWIFICIFIIILILLSIYIIYQYI